jgi:hypothetical protein
MLWEDKPLLFRGLRGTTPNACGLAIAETEPFPIRRVLSDARAEVTSTHVFIFGVTKRLVLPVGAFLGPFVLAIDNLIEDRTSDRRIPLARTLKAASLMKRQSWSARSNIHLLVGEQNGKYVQKCTLALRNCGQIFEM